MAKQVVSKTVAYARFQHRYGGKFIARTNGKVLASGATYPTLLRAIRKQKLNRKRLTIGYVPPKGAICIYAYGG